MCLTSDTSTWPRSEWETTTFVRDTNSYDSIKIVAVIHISNINLIPFSKIMAIILKIARKYDHTAKLMQRLCSGMCYYLLILFFLWHLEFWPRCCLPGYFFKDVAVKFQPGKAGRTTFNKAYSNVASCIIQDWTDSWLAAGIPDGWVRGLLPCFYCPQEILVSWYWEASLGVITLWPRVSWTDRQLYYAALSLKPLHQQWQKFHCLFG